MNYYDISNIYRCSSMSTGIWIKNPDIWVKLPSLFS